MKEGGRRIGGRNDRGNIGRTSAKILSRHIEDINISMEESQLIANRINPKRRTVEYIAIKLVKSNIKRTSKEKLSQCPQVRYSQ